MAMGLIMSKGLVAGVALVALGATGYLAGVYFSGEQVGRFVEQSLQVAQQQVAEQGEVVVKSEKGFFSSRYDVTYTVEGLTPEMEAVLGGPDIPMVLEVEHGFLAANSTLILAASPLLEQLRQNQVTQEKEPFELKIKQRFNPLSQSIEIEGTFESDRFKFTNEDQGTADIGAGKVFFTQVGREFKLDAVMADSELKDDDFTLRIEGVKAHEKGRMDHDDPFQAVMAETMEGELSIQRVISSTELYSAELKELSLTIKQLIENTRLISHVGYKAAEILVEDLSQTEKTQQVISQPTLQVTFDLDHQTSRNLIQLMSQMESSEEMAQQAMAELIGAVDKVSQQGVAVNVTDLSFGLNEQRAEGVASLTLAPFAVSHVMANPQLLQEKMQLDASFQVPVAMLALLPDYNPDQIEGMKALGFITESDGFYRVDLKVSEGQVQLNGQPLPM